jgi:ceramide glucosyltransferase
MLDMLIEGLALGCLLLAVLGCIHALVAVFVVRHFGAQRMAGAAAHPAVTILKPLRGAEPALAANLASFCEQDYHGPVQVLFGIQDPADAAIPIVGALIRDRPAADLRLCMTTAARGANPKVANLAAMQGEIAHDIVVIADSDIAVDRDYLARLIAALEGPGVGLVTCLYRGEPHGGLWARLAAMAIDYRFLPDVLVGLALGLARPCFGSTIALRRETLRAIGGFDAFIDQLADDYAIGAAVRATGLTVAIPPLIVRHGFSERTAVELLRHELRWARTLRAASPAGYAGLAITHPLPCALIGAILGGAAAAGWAVVIAALACRLVLHVQVDHTLGARPRSILLGPARDVVAFAVYVASFFVGVVSWRGHRYSVRADGTLQPLGDQKA